MSTRSPSCVLRFLLRHNVPAAPRVAVNNDLRVSHRSGASTDPLLKCPAKALVICVPAQIANEQARPRCSNGRHTTGRVERRGVWWEGRTHVAKSGRPGSIGNEVSVEALPAERRVVVKPLSTRGPQCGCFKGLAKTALRGRASHAAGANTSLRRQNAPVRAQWRRCRRYSCASVQPPFRRRVRLAQCPRPSPQPAILRWAPKRLGIEAWQVHLPKESGAMKGGRRPKKQVSHR